MNRIAERDETRPESLPARTVAVVGPTGSGKSALALRLAERCGGEIVSTDSLQVYRGLDIGTAKPSPAERARVPHHLIDVADPDEAFSAGSYVRQARAVLERLAAAGRTAILCGGTGLYYRALTEGLAEVPEIPEAVRGAVAARMRSLGAPALHEELAALDPQAAARLHPRDSQRIARALEVVLATGRSLSAFQQARPFRAAPENLMLVGLAWERVALYERLNGRVLTMLEQGWVDEVRGLLARGYAPNLKPLRAIGYREIVALLEGRLPRERLAEEIARATRRYAKRQWTWFRNQARVLWAPPEAEERIGDAVERFLRPGSGPGA